MFGAVMLAKLWQVFCEFILVVQQFFMTSCCPGLEGLDDDESEDDSSLCEPLLKDRNDSIRKQTVKTD